MREKACRLNSLPWDGLWIPNYSGGPGMNCQLHQYGQGRWNGKNPVDLNRLYGAAKLEDLTEVFAVTGFREGG